MTIILVEWKKIGQRFVADYFFLRLVLFTHMLALDWEFKGEWNFIQCATATQVVILLHRVHIRFGGCNLRLDKFLDLMQQDVN